MTLADLGWAGITATVAYGKLRLSAPPGVLTAAMQERIAASRDDLLRELAQDAQRAHLLAVAPDELLPADLVHGLRDADVVACDGGTSPTRKRLGLPLIGEFFRTTVEVDGIPRESAVARRKRAPS